MWHQRHIFHFTWVQVRGFYYYYTIHAYIKYPLNNYVSKASLSLVCKCTIIENRVFYWNIFLFTENLKHNFSIRLIFGPKISSDTLREKWNQRKNLLLKLLISLTVVWVCDYFRHFFFKRLLDNVSASIGNVKWINTFTLHRMLELCYYTCHIDFVIQRYRQRLLIFPI